MTECLRRISSKSIIDVRTATKFIPTVPSLKNLFLVSSIGHRTAKRTDGSKLSRGDEIRAIVELRYIWLNNGKFGATWVALQVQHRSNSYQEVESPTYFIRLKYLRVNN
eukprot:SAG22_NODE_125_length_18883_cov_12.351629_11_plen_109_part_00